MESTRLMNVSAQEAHPCIWMQAGVVSRKLCQIKYDCPSCRFDRILRRVSDENLSLMREGAVPKGKRGLIVSWQQKLRSQPATKRPCIHHMKGRIEFKACTNDYKCANCDFDQYFNDQYSVHAVMSPMDVLDVKGFKVPQGYYFHPGHTWIKVEEGSSVRVGIDEFALRLLGPLDHIEALGNCTLPLEAQVLITNTSQDPIKPTGWAVVLGLTKLPGNHPSLHPDTGLSFF